MRSIIVGTAGHIDHGKTSLVEALTGTNADRLPEEKRRGITIDLGFASLDLPDAHLGFVDVPGHERFVRNMLAGAHGIDLVLLIVAADEGVMPQTREHFDICRLLGLRAGIVCLTKQDAADDDLRQLVRLEVEELVENSFLESAPVIETSVRTGAGLDELKSALAQAARDVPERAGGYVARLPVDRAFAMRGFGTIVTGTLVAGAIGARDELELLPAGQAVRARGVQVHGQTVESARAGERTAINLGGIDVHEIERGQVLSVPQRLRSTQIFDARLDVLSDAARPLRSRARVRLHHGAAEVLARVAVIEDAREIAQGESGYAQLRLESPLVVIPGDRFILRSYSPAHTIAGGVVLDAFASKHRRRDFGKARARLEVLASANRTQMLAAFVEGMADAGLTRSDLAARTGWTDELIETESRAVLSAYAVKDAGGGVLIANEAVESLLSKAVRAVKAHHARDPLARGMMRETLREQIFTHTPAEIFRFTLAEAERSGALVSERDTVRASSHSLELAGEDARLHTRLAEVFRDAALEAPGIDEALTRAGIAPARREHGRKLLRLLIGAGTLVQITPDLLVHRDALDRIIGATREYAATHEPERAIDVHAFKDLAGVSRKYAIPILEYFDRERITRRAGDRRIVN